VVIQQQLKFQVILLIIRLFTLLIILLKAIIKLLFVEIKVIIKLRFINTRFIKVTHRLLTKFFIIIIKVKLCVHVYECEITIQLIGEGVQLYAMKHPFIKVLLISGNEFLILMMDGEHVRGVQIIKVSLVIKDDEIIIIKLAKPKGVIVIIK
jgi:hypothetical protein